LKSTEAWGTGTMRIPVAVGPPCSPLHRGSSPLPYPLSPIPCPALPCRTPRPRLMRQCARPFRRLPRIPHVSDDLLSAAGQLLASVQVSASRPPFDRRPCLPPSDPPLTGVPTLPLAEPYQVRDGTTPPSGCPSGPLRCPVSRALPPFLALH
jgi:hypothetical protein